MDARGQAHTQVNMEVVVANMTSRPGIDVCPLCRELLLGEVDDWHGSDADADADADAAVDLDRCSRLPCSHVYHIKCICHEVLNNLRDFCTACGSRFVSAVPVAPASRPGPTMSSSAMTVPILQRSYTIVPGHVHNSEEADEALVARLAATTIEGARHALIVNGGDVVSAIMWLGEQ